MTIRFLVLFFVLPFSVSQASSDFSSMKDYAFSSKVTTDCVLIYQAGRKKFGHCQNGFDLKTRHRLWSISKSIVNLLFGIAVQEGKIDIEKSAGAYYPALAEGNKKKIRVRHLLQMNSGLYWRENYLNPLKSSVLQMLYQAKDMALFAASMPVENAPGEMWKYSSGTSNILMAVLRSALGDKTYADYPWRKLFNPLGIRSAVWEKDRSGNYIGSSYLFLNPEDLAKVGRFVLEGGVWNRRRILPKDWMRFSRELPAGYRNTSRFRQAKRAAHGAHWWTNRTQTWPDSPKDLVVAMGYQEQRLYILPTQELVIVRLGKDKHRHWDDNFFLSSILKDLKAPPRVAKVSGEVE